MEVRGLTVIVYGLCGNHALNKVSHFIHCSLESNSRAGGKIYHFKIFSCVSHLEIIQHFSTASKSSDSVMLLNLSILLLLNIQIIIDT